MKPARCIIFLLFLLCGYYVSAQEKCATVKYNESLQKKNQGKGGTKIFESWLKDKIDLKKATPHILQLQQENIYIIPVVVHVVHFGEPIGSGSNISDEQIESQINALNQDYRRLNFDTIYTPEIFRAVAVDTHIEFRLASRNPSGGPTNGIVRIKGTQSSWNAESTVDDQVLKSLSFWPPEDYLNIWVTNLSGKYLGYAQYPETDLPGSLPPYTRETDGVVIDYEAFGSVSGGSFPNLKTEYNLGRTTTHEIGHYLGLRHIWGDDGTACTGTDYCDDTPNQAGSHDSCQGIDPFSCGSEDMYENYLDYTYDACMNIFTMDQKIRMRTVLENSPRRASLLTSPALLPPDNYPNRLVIRNIEAPANISCSEFFTPQLFIQNIGTNSVTEFDVAVTLDNTQYTDIKFEDTLSPGMSKVISVFDATDQIMLTKGQHYIKVGIRNVNGIDSLSNNSQNISKYFLSSPARDFIPLREKFEFPDLAISSWDVYNPDNAKSWELMDLPLGSKVNHGMEINLYDYTNIGQVDWLVSPVLDLSGVSDANMTFDYSYAQYDSNQDRLDVRVSLDCGKSFPYTLYSKYSPDLSERIYSYGWIPLVPQDWNREFIDMSDFAGMSQVRIAFVSINGHGNNLFIDNVEFYETGFSKDLNLNENSMIIHPNPTLDGLFYVTVNTPERQPVEISIIDMVGRMVMHRSFDNVLNQTFEFQIVAQRNAIYLVSVTGPTFHQTSRVFLDK